jgi:hypothetical protein
MRLFAFVIALLGVFVYLCFHFSFWVALCAMYMIGMIAVALIASFGKHQTSSQLAWNEPVETDSLK